MTNMVPISEVKAIAIAIASKAMKEVFKEVIIKWWRIGFLCGLTVGWIAGSSIMLWLQ